MGRKLACLNLHHLMAASQSIWVIKPRLRLEGSQGQTAYVQPHHSNSTGTSFVRRPHQKQLTLPAQHAVAAPPVRRAKEWQRAVGRRPQAAALGQQRALRGDARGRRQNDGRVPRAQRHRALHPVRDEYCKFDPAGLTLAPSGWCWEAAAGRTICLTLGVFFFSGGQVAKLYRDASLGNVVNIIVTRLIVLTEDQVRETPPTTTTPTPTPPVS